MTRKSSSPQRAPARAKRTRLHLPQSWRAVTTRKLRNTSGDQAHNAQRCEVPEIRLSGAWLERIGFVKGRRYLISADRQIETIYLQADVTKPMRRKRSKAG